MAGYLADKLGNFRLFMAALTLLNGASSLLLLAVPAVNETSSVVVNATLSSIVAGENHWTSEQFWTYLCIRVLLDFLRASSLMLFEGAVVSIIKQHGGDYGLQKLFGTFGAVIFGPLSGVLIDQAKSYQIVIIIYFVTRALAALCILKLDLQFKVNASKCLCALH